MAIVWIEPVHGNTKVLTQCFKGVSPSGVTLSCLIHQSTCVIPIVCILLNTLYL